MKDFICTAPWEGLFINPDGDCRVCCAGDSLGNLNKNTIQEIVQNGKLKEVQTDILTKGHSNYCHGCMDMERVQGRSLRDGYGKDLSIIDTTKFKPSILDIRWRNACQLRCLYCNSEWSSTYAQWEGKTYKVSDRNWQQEVLDYIVQNKPEHFKHVYMLGGEPFILKENEQLLDLIPDTDIIGFVTNLSIPDMHTLPMYEKIMNKNASFLVSLENIGNKFEYVRRNGSWVETEKNYKKLLERKPNSVGCHMTYNLLSAFSLVETFDWIHSIHPDKNDNKSLLTILLSPNMFNMNHYPKEIKQLAIDEFNRLEEKYCDWLSDVQLQFITHTRQSLLDNIDECRVDSLKEFMEYIKLTDVGMGPITFKSEWPDVARIIESYLE
jgi:MoaA/NifB/PqqE/SkfB family radical SAM enzyme